jgi:predicted kinase
MIVIMAGLPGTGKTTLARALAARTTGRVVSKDEIRSALFTPGGTEYSTKQDDFCLQVMLELAGYLLRRGPQQLIFLDGRPFSRRYQINSILSAADSLHQHWRILECVCDENVVRRRLQEQGRHPATNRDFDLYLRVKAQFEEITELKTVIDTGHALEDCVQRGLAAFG